MHFVEPPRVACVMSPTGTLLASTMSPTKLASTSNKTEKRAEPADTYGARTKAKGKGCAADGQIGGSVAFLTLTGLVAYSWLPTQRCKPPPLRSRPRPLPLPLPHASAESALGSCSRAYASLAARFMTCFGGERPGRPHGASVTNSSPAVGWMATQASKSALVAPIFIATPKPWSTSSLPMPIWGGVAWGGASGVDEGEPGHVCWGRRVGSLVGGVRERECRAAGQLWGCPKTQASDRRDGVWPQCVA